MRVTADSNIYISALLFGGRPMRLLELAQAGVLELAISLPILDEIGRVLRDKFRLPEASIDEALTLISSFTVRVEPAQQIDVVSADPTDNRILECAVAAGSRCIVTGDKHLLRIGRFEGIEIITLHDLLARVQE